MPTQTMTPYDTGTRCEPQLWQSDRADVLEVMRHGDAEDIGNVDFDDDESHTVATVHVSGNDDGTWTVHVMPLVADDELEIEVHSQ